MKKIPYETAIKELQTILAELQEGTISVDDLTTKVKRAQELISFCKNQLRDTEKAIQALLEED